LVEEVVSSFKKVTSANSLADTESETSSEDTDQSDNFCPFRDLKALGRDAPPGSLTICKIISSLHRNCPCLTKSEIGEIYFEVDKEMNGYVYVKDLPKRLPAALKRNCCLDAGKVDFVVKQLSSMETDGSSPECD